MTKKLYDFRLEIYREKVKILLIAKEEREVKIIILIQRINISNDLKYLGTILDGNP